jgi:hypothetical protein
MEQQILAIIEEEVNIISKTYDIPIEQLIKDTATIECTFCKGVLASKKRCLKQPKDNGYCGFHQSQVPPPPPKPAQRVTAPWET